MIHEPARRSVVVDVPRPEQVHRRILAADIEAFASLDRTDPIRSRLRNRLYRLLDQGLVAAEVNLKFIERSDQGDCVLVLVDPHVPLVPLLYPLVPRLAADLADSNRGVPPLERLRLRLVIHFGEILRDEHGYCGEALNHAFRLLDAQVVRNELARNPTVDIVLVASEAIYQAVIKHGFDGIDPSGYWPVQIQNRETDSRAWVHLPGLIAQPWSERP